MGNIVNNKEIIVINKKEVEKFCKEHGITEDQFYGRERIKWSTDFSNVVTIPEGFSPRVRGNLNLISVTSIPKGFSPNVGGCLELGNLTCVTEGFNPVVGGNLYLRSATSIPEGFDPVVVGDLDLFNLISIPKDFSPVVGRSLRINRNTSIPECFRPTVGGKMSIMGVTCPEDTNNFIVKNGYVYSPGVGYVNAANKHVAYPLTWKNGRYILDDEGYSERGVLFEVVGQEDIVYNIRVAGRVETSYLIMEGTSWSYGKTKNEVIEAFKYKSKPKAFSEYKSSVTLDTELPSFAEAVAFFRSVTGASHSKVRVFVEDEGLDTNKPSYSVREMLDLVEGESFGDSLSVFLKIPGNEEESSTDYDE